MRGLPGELKEASRHMLVALIVAVALRWGLGVDRDLAWTAALLAVVVFMAADEVVARLTPEEQ